MRRLNPVLLFSLSGDMCRWEIESIEEKNIRPQWRHLMYENSIRFVLVIDFPLEHDLTSYFAAHRKKL